jgi:Spy/CpxP family protein refolding chaperone
MKRAVVITFALVLFLALGVNCANAQPAETSEPALQQDSSPSVGPSMMSEYRRGAMEDMAMSAEEVMERRYHFMQLMMDLGLDENQMEKIHDIVDNAAKDLIKKGADIFVARIDLEDIIHREPIDMKAVESQLNRLERMKTETFLARLKAYEQIRSALTAEQKERLQKMIDMHMMGRSAMESGKAQGEEKKMNK